MHVWLLLVDDRYTGSDDCPASHWRVQGVYASREAGVAEANRCAARYGSTLDWFKADNYSEAHDRMAFYEVRREEVGG